MRAITAQYGRATNARRNQVRTDDSRLNNYIQFSEKLGLEPQLKEIDLGAQTAIAIAYLASLTAGDTILGIKVRYETLKGYMDTFAAYVQQATGRDIRNEPQAGVHMSLWLPHPLFASIYQETKRWQGIPHRQDPVTKEMIAWLQRHGINKDRYCYVNALVDWVVLGLHTGYRGAEWCQQVDPTKHSYYEY